MTLHSRWQRVLLRMVFVAGIFVAACLLIEGAVNVIGSRKDASARVVAEARTEDYRKLFRDGESYSQVEAEMQKLKLGYVSRGDELLIVAQEGRGIWYCSHNYFGTALRFQDKKLTRLDTDEWLETCL